VRFEVWAPKPERVRLRIRDPDGTEHDLPMQRQGEWWWREVPEAKAGTDYGFLLDDDPTPLPDPRSRWQPEGVHGLSRIYDHGAYQWGDRAWTGRTLPGSVIYELHVGTFTPEGTFDAAIDKLDYLVDLGVDFVELLPVNAFNGVYNWGYDGVGWYAVHEPYGGPDGLKRFVDACHQRGLAVVIDAVYNHFGPSGNYAPRFAPYLKQGRNTWGDLINLDGPGSDQVRRFIIDSALAWLRDYHVDALRLDAVHAFMDQRALHLLEELAIEVEALSAALGRPLSLIAESDRNDPRLILPREAGGYGLTAQWDDDVHHAVHALLTGERQGYYSDFGSAECLATVLTGAFFHDGRYSTFRGRSHGRRVDRERVPGHRFVVCLQNHDQIGNRALGDRIATLLSPGLVKIGAALILTSPFTPMLFMGEEWGATTPWQFFTSHPEPELATAVADGRRREFAAHGWATDQVPDPQDPETFRRSRLDWTQLHTSPHKEILSFYRQLIRLRRSRPDLTDPRLDRVRVAYGDGYITVYRGRHTVVCNLSAERLAIPLEGTPVEVALASEPGFTFANGVIELSPESVAVVELL